MCGGQSIGRSFGRSVGQTSGATATVGVRVREGRAAKREEGSHIVFAERIKMMPACGMSSARRPPAALRLPRLASLGSFMVSLPQTLSPLSPSLPLFDLQLLRGRRERATQVPQTDILPLFTQAETTHARTADDSSGVVASVKVLCLHALHAECCCLLVSRLHADQH